MKTGEKVHQELEKRKDSTSGGEKRKKGASEEPKTGEKVHQELENKSIKFKIQCQQSMFSLQVESLLL